MTTDCNDEPADIVWEFGALLKLLAPSGLPRQP
jgi:hypothetical protein